MISRRQFMQSTVTAAMGAALGAESQAFASQDKPNVLFISIDDLNNWVGCLGGHPQARTPNMDRLANRGVLFRNAHCSAPLCNPSRTSVMTGLHPTTSGVLGNMQDWRQAPALQNRKTLPQYFKEHGYWTGAAGKLYHSNHGGETGALTGGHGGRQGFNHPPSWTERYPSHDVQLPMPAMLAGQNNNGLDIWHWDWGGMSHPDEATVDWRTTDWVIQQLYLQRQQPFFLGLGIYRPHSPWYLPQAYLDEFDLDSIQLPLIREDDIDDLPDAAIHYLRNPNHFHKLVMENNLYKEAVQAYLASICFADAMLGRVLDVLEASPYADNTIVVLWSDHGWHLGEKQRWHKSTLWEDATQVPLIVSVPGMETAGQVCDRAVSLLDLYPTLLELCGLPSLDNLDGISLAAQLTNPATERSRPAVTSRKGNHHSVRNDRWRYIRYNDGSEELYDHRTDPHEWDNLIGNEEYAYVVREMARWMPASENAPLPK